MKARDIMSTNLVTISPEATIENAARLMADENISGIPVINNEGEMVGMISEGDLLGKHKQISPPAYIEFLGGIFFTESQDKYFEDIKRHVATHVKDLMTEKVISINPDTPLEEIATIMFENKIKRLPVLEDGELVGIVSRADVVKAAMQ